MLLLGPIIGCVRYSIITIGIEVSHTTDVSIHIHNSMGNMISSYMDTVPCGTLYTIDIPIQEYEGRYIVCVQTCGTTTYGSFMLKGRIAAISCNNRQLGNISMWNHLGMNNDISTCIHMGDNIYMDNGSDTFNTAMSMVSKGWDPVINVFRQAYRDLWSSTHMHNILSSHINIFLWDDHDVCDSWDQFINIDNILYMRDSNGYIVWKDIAQSYMNDHRKVAILAAIQVYCEYQLSLSLGGRVHIPGSFTYHIGDKNVLFVDRRSHRGLGTSLIPYTLDTNPDIVVTGVPIFFIHPLLCNTVIDNIARYTIGIRDIRDQWILDRVDTEEILSILKDGSIILCGDVHMCGNTTISMDNGSNTYTQITSSGISTPSPPYIIPMLLRMLSSYQIDIGNRRLHIQHNSWTRSNGYVTICTYGNTIEYSLYK